MTFFTRALGIDQAVVWFYLSNMWAFIRGPLNLFFILRYLSVEQQGLWYTFSNLATLTLFADLGFILIIAQFVSHEYSRLSFIDGQLSGNPRDLDRLVGLVRYAVQFYCAVIVLAILILSVAGIYYFADHPPAVRSAWILFSIAGGLGLLSHLLQSIYRGLDRVAFAQQAVLTSFIITSLYTWLALGLELSIFALPIGALCGTAALFYLLFRGAPRLWLQLLRHTVTQEFHGAREIAVLQGKYALTFASTYFIFSLLVPAVFKLEGAATAGRLGLTIAMIGVVQGFALAGINARIPKINILIATDRWRECAEFMRRQTLVGCAIYLAGAVALLGCVWMLDKFNIAVGRFLEWPLFLLVIAYQMAPTLTMGASTFLRAQKREPHVPIAIGQAIVIGVAMFTVLPQYGLFWMLVVMNIAFWLISVPPIFIMARNSLRRHEQAKAV